MQNFQNAIEHIGNARPRLGFSRLVLAHKQRLGEFEIPIAEHVPRKAIGRIRRVVKPERFNRGRDVCRCMSKLANGPAVKLQFDRLWIKASGAGAIIHFGKARRIPDFGREIAIAFNALRRKLDVAALGRHRGERKAQGIRAILVNKIERIDHIALGFGHLRALLVADKGVDIDRMKRFTFHKVIAHHHHAGDPEEDDVEACNEHVSRIIPSKLGCCIRPAECRERPKCGREPRIEHVFIANKHSI